MSGKKSSYNVKSVGKALDIIEELADYEEGIGLTELSKRLSINKSTVYRLIKTLENRKYLEQKKDNTKYQIGIRLIGVSSKIIENLDIKNVARPYLKELNKKTQETIHLAIIDEQEEEMVYIDKVESYQPIRMYSAVGKRVPLHSTSLGKVILAYLQEEKSEEILNKANLVKFTPNTITDKEELIAKIKRVRQQGYAIDDEENDENVRCIAAPIFNNEGEVIGAFSVSGPSIRLTHERIESLSRLLKDYSMRISNAFGYNNFSDEGRKL